MLVEQLDALVADVEVRGDAPEICRLQAALFLVVAHHLTAVERLRRDVNHLAALLHQRRIVLHAK